MYNVTDVHDLLQDESFLKYLSPNEGAYLVRPTSVTEETLKRLAGAGNTYGDGLPWRVHNDKLRFRPSEITLWVGINGHGKSLLTSQAALHFCRLKRTTVIASMEMPLDATVARMVRQLAGNHDPSEEWARRSIRWLDRGIWLYDKLQNTPADRVVALCWYAAMELEADHIFIDSMVKCGIAIDDFKGQMYFVDALCNVAKSTGLHIHLVHHSRKTQSEENIPDKFDVRGSSAITDLVDNVVLLHRNKRKERLKRTDDEKWSDDQPDALFGILKQRHGDWEGRIPLWYHDSGQYTNSKERRPEYIDIDS